MKKINEFSDLKLMLPIGFSKTILERLAKKGVNFSKSTIYNCLSGRSQSFHKIIIDEALLLADEYQTSLLLQKSRLKESISALSNKFSPLNSNGDEHSNAAGSSSSAGYLGTTIEGVTAE